MYFTVTAIGLSATYIYHTSVQNEITISKRLDFWRPFLKLYSSNKAGTSYMITIITIITIKLQMKVKVN